MDEASGGLQSFDSIPFAEEEHSTTQTRKHTGEHTGVLTAFGVAFEWFLDGFHSLQVVTGSIYE